MSVLSGPIHSSIDKPSRDVTAQSSYVCNRYHNTSSVSGMIEQLEWDTLEERRGKYRLCMFYKVINGLVAIPTGVYLQEAKPLHIHNHLATYTKTCQNPVLPV